MRTYTIDGIYIAEAPASRCAVEILDAKKSTMPENSANAGFFATYHENGLQFTLPVAHLIADFSDVSAPALKYMKERGTIAGDKWYFDSAKWKYMNDFSGKAVSTLYIRDGKAWVSETVNLGESDYAVSGAPVVRNGKASTMAEAQVQGWSGGSLYATQHIFVGLKEAAETLYIMHLTTENGNLISSGEAAAKFLALGFKDVIKLDGGSSTRWQFGDTVKKTSENRQIHNIIRIKGESSSSDATSEKGDDTMASTGSKTQKNVMFKIALGAGHYFNTPGKRCLKSIDPNETREWWLNDRICDYVESRLNSYEGYKLLRLDDSDDGADDVTLAERVNSANTWGADFYLSVHHNAGINGGSGGGIVAYTYPSSSVASVEWRNALYKALIEHTGLKGNRSNPMTTSNLYVLRNSKMPAVLLELGFMDSTTDVPIILSDKYAQQCADAIVEVIVKRGNLTKKAPQSSGVLYRVQVGAFENKQYAENLKAELIEKGYPAYVKKG